MLRKTPLFFILFALIVITYFNSLGNGFVIDDQFLILENSSIRSLKNIPTLLGFSDRLIFRPVRELTYTLDYFLYGYNPTGYHLSNIFFLFLSCCVVYFISFYFFQNRLLAFFTSVIFALHPIHTEAVTYISGRKDILAGLFYFLGIYCFIKYRETDKKKYLIATLINYVLAIFSKEIALTLPIILFLFDYYNLSRSLEGTGIKKTLKTIKAIFNQYAGLYISLLILVSLSFVYFILIRSFSGINYTKPLDIYGTGQTLNLFTQIKITGLYLKLLLFPIYLNADYTFNAIPLSLSFFELQVAGSLIIILLLLFVAIIFVNSGSMSIVSFFLFSLIGSMLPIIQIIKYPEIISERSLFIPSLFFCLLLTFSISNIKSISKKNLVIIFLLIGTLYSTRTIYRNFDWKDSQTLWEKTVLTSPASARAHYNLGTIYAKIGRYQKAKVEFEKSLAINPEKLTTIPDYTIDAFLNLGNVFYLEGKNRDAIRSYKKVLKLDPGNKGAIRNIKRAKAKLLKHSH